MQIASPDVLLCSPGAYENHFTLRMHMWGARQVCISSSLRAWQALYNPNRGFQPFLFYCKPVLRLHSTPLRELFHCFMSTLSYKRLGIFLNANQRM